MRKERLVFALAVASVCTALVGLLRPGSGSEGMPRELYWAKKIAWPAQFDLVVTGDSRVLIDVSPAAMGEVLPALRIGNFAFEGNGYSADYLVAIENLLEPGGRRIIVLGITPVSLTPLSERSSNFKWLREKHAVELGLQTGLGEIPYFFRPCAWVQSFAETGWLGEEDIYHADGWVSSSLVPEQPEASLDPYRTEAFAGNKVSPRIVDGLLQVVERWTEEGYLVFGFRPPTTVALFEVELELSGFEESAFVYRFRQAGGIWLPFPHGFYPSYDGSHLSDYAAVDFSRDLAGKIGEILDGGITEQDENARRK
jgi:hypothetical protein